MGCLDFMIKDFSYRSGERETPGTRSVKTMDIHCDGLRVRKFFALCHALLVAQHPSVISPLCHFLSVGVIIHLPDQAFQKRIFSWRGTLIMMTGLFPSDYFKKSCSYWPYA